MSAPRRTPAQAQMLAAVAAGDVELVASPRGGYYWRVSGVRCSTSADRMLDRLVDEGVVSTGPRVDSACPAISI